MHVTNLCEFVNTGRLINLCDFYLCILALYAYYGEIKNLCDLHSTRISSIKIYHFTIRTTYVDHPLTCHRRWEWGKMWPWSHPSAPWPHPPLCLEDSSSSECPRQCTRSPSRRRWGSQTRQSGCRCRDRWRQRWLRWWQRLRHFFSLDRHRLALMICDTGMMKYIMYHKFLLDKSPATLLSLIT